MRRTILLCLCTYFVTSMAPLQAQETVENELEMVRQLRSRNWHELAKTKIEELLKRNDPALNAALPLELARVNIAIARQQDPEQRFALFTAARAQLQDHITRNKGKADAALSSAELARLTSYHAQALLTRAMREEDNRSKHEKARPAETMFLQAGKDLEEAIKLLDAAIAEATNASLKNLLQQEHKQARFDIAINLFDQARTYIDRGKTQVNAARSGIMDKSRAAFLTLRSDESSQVGWLANAWLMKCSMELDAPDDVTKYYDFILKRKDDKNAQPAIQPAVRLIRYFHLQDVAPPREDLEAIGRSPKYGKMKTIERLRAVQKEGDAWLKAYPAHLKSFEGQGVLFELGYSFLSEAYGEKDDKAAGLIFDKALIYFDKLVEIDGDLAERARQAGLSIRYKRLDAKTVLRTFDEFLMRGMLERQAVIDINQKLDDPKAADRAGLETQRKRRLQQVIAALSKALTLASPKTPVQKVDDARYYLCSAHLAAGDVYRGTIVAESLARSRPPTRRSPEGAAIALGTYANLLNRSPDDHAIRQRLQDLAEFVLSPANQPTWSADPVTALAHWHLAMAAHRDNNPKKAIAHLEQLKPDAAEYIFTQGQLFFIAEAAREKAEDAREKQFYVAAAKAALARMPKLNPKNEPSSALSIYFSAKVEMSRYLYREAMEDSNAREELKAIKKCNEMIKYIKELESEFEQVPQHVKGSADDDYVPNGRLSKQKHEQIQFSLSVMLKYADLGIAEAKFRSESPTRFDDVIKATNNVVTQMLAEAKSIPGDKLIQRKDYVVVGDILGLALRAHVQSGDKDKGMAILEILKRLSSPEGKAGGNVVTLLLRDIATQVKRMKAEHDKTLATTKDRYGAFLDEIAKEFEKKGYDNSAATMIAHTFISLEYPVKAADMFAKIKPPTDLDQKVEKKPNENEAQEKRRLEWEERCNRYWATQLEYIRALRACKTTEAQKSAEQVITTMLKHPTASYKIQVMMEKNLLLEDQQKYAEAYIQWNGSKTVKGFLQLPVFKDLGNKDVQNIFFTGYFYAARTLYKYGALDPKTKDRAKFIDGAANMIIKLEYSKTKDGWEIARPMFLDLLREEPDLKKAYDKLKAVQEKGGSSLDAPRPAATIRVVHADVTGPGGRSSISLGVAALTRVWADPRSGERGYAKFGLDDAPVPSSELRCSLTEKRIAK